MDVGAISSLIAPTPSAPIAGPSDRDKEKIRAVAKEFEGMVLGELLAPMFEGLPTDGLGGGGAGEAMFRPMLVQRYAEAMSKAGGIGLADNVMAEMIRLQGAGNGADR